MLAEVQDKLITMRDGSGAQAALGATGGSWEDAAAATPVPAGGDAEGGAGGDAEASASESKEKAAAEGEAEA